MERAQVISAFGALAQETRLDTCRLLAQAGQEGMPAGDVAASLGQLPNTLSFHFKRLRQAGLVTMRREGQSSIYSLRPDTMSALLGFLSENCRAGVGSTAPIQSGPKSEST
jgi:ArsR family transcriptional regulator, arsenate/arsenite/antimonite-responsive transcriptional repressor